MKIKISLLVTYSIILVAFTLTFLGCDGGDSADDLIGEDADFVYFAVGASDALGVGAIPEDDGYVFIIEDVLDEELEGDVDLCFFCLAAIAAAELDQIENLADEFLDAGVEPDIVTILVGANDIIEGVDPMDFESQLRELIDRILLASPDAFIVMGNIPNLTMLPRFDEGEDPDVTEENIMTFNAIIAEVALDFGIPVVNLFAILITDEFVADDGFHPSDQGHERIAELFLDVILAGFDPSMTSSMSASPFISPFPSPSP